ncbi:MAG: deoxyribonuclease IV, partial [Thermoleophilia bacterium]|nr:deoxyribonuclease IV [Thermoleophilia bacterium]
ARAEAMGAEVVQVFSSNPRMWRSAEPDPEALDQFGAALREKQVPLFFHAIYLINLASADDQLRRRSAEALAHSLLVGGLAGAAGAVVHVGSHGGRGFAETAPVVLDTVRAARETASRALATLAAGTGHSPALPPLLLETGAGSGTTIGSSLEELAELLAALPPTSGLCLDTAHLFAAGYPIHEAGGLETFVAHLARLDLLGSVRLVHLNDSGGLLGSKRDRHVNPGQGEIGRAALTRIVRHPVFARIPFVLEVPGPEKQGPSRTEIETVKRMRRTAPVPPGAPAPAA